MEEILASIKRIIADEPTAAPRAQSAPPMTARPADWPQPSLSQRPAAVPPPPAWSERPPPHEDAVLELTERVPEPIPARPTPQPAVRIAEPQPPAQPPVQRAVDRLREAEARRAPDRRPAAAGPVPEDLMPRAPSPPSAQRSIGSDATLEQLARELLEPMLAEWIERNLPDMVERIVQAEISRIMDNR